MKFNVVSIFQLQSAISVFFQLILASLLLIIVLTDTKIFAETGISLRILKNCFFKHLNQIYTIIRN